MASEQDIELLDQYLSNKMTEGDRHLFEARMESDPALNQEYLFQKQIIEGIRTTRLTELKSMLNNVAIPSGGGSAMISGKVIGWISVAVIVGSLIVYFNWPDNQKEIAPAEKAPAISPTTETTIEAQPESVKPEADALKEKKKEKVSSTITASKVKTAKEPKKQASSKVDPVIEVFDPTAELQSSDSNTEVDAVDTAMPTGSALSTPSVAVETISDNKKYNFHYQFASGKLILYGSFEKNLFEVLEFFGDNRKTIFLYYKNNFYRLDDTKTQVTPLVEVSDPKLLKKLRENREK